MQKSHVEHRAADGDGKSDEFGFGSSQTRFYELLGHCNSNILSINLLQAFVWTFDIVKRAAIESLAASAAALRRLIGF